MASMTFWVIKLDYNGTIEWQNTIGANFSDLLSSVIQTPDGGYLLAGSSVSDNSGDKTENNVGFPFGLPYYTYFDYWVIKIDALGNIQWDNTIGSKLTDGATVAVNASDSGYLIGGYTYCDVSGDQTEPCYGDIDGWILKLDLDGNILWQKKFGGNNRDMLQTMISTSDGGYLFGFDSNSNISGQKTENNLGGKDYWIIKVDAFGTVLWDKTIGGSSDDVITDLKEDNNGNYYAVGFSNSNISGNKTQNSIGGYDNWVMKLNSDGNIIWDKTIGGSDNDYNSSFEYLVTDDSLIIGGTSNSPISGDKTADTRGLYDYWIVKLESDHLKSTAFEDSKISVFPNPTAKDISIDLQQTFQNIHLKLINPLGQLIFEKKYTDTSKIELTLDGSKGVYFLHLTNPNDEKLIFKIAKE
ncbi:MAG: T9SS type A sorting domain-containing protein [Flavobacteriaceae bacterium]